MQELDNKNKKLHELSIAYTSNDFIRLFLINCNILVIYYMFVQSSEYSLVDVIVLK